MAGNLTLDGVIHHIINKNILLTRLDFAATPPLYGGGVLLIRTFSSVG